MNKNKIALILGFVCMMLTIAICIQIKTVEDEEKEVGKTLSSNDGLKDEILKLRERYNNIHKLLEKSEGELEKIRESVVYNNDLDSQKEEDIKNMNKFLGFTELKGPGIKIYLDDNRNVSSDKVININNYLVHEEDLLQVINELYNAGAEAISINGQRIVSTSEIMCDGNIIRINGELIGVPITISAIGYPSRLYYALNRPDGYLTAMKRDGVVVRSEEVTEITIPKFSGVYNSDYIN